MLLTKAQKRQMEEALAEATLQRVQFSKIPTGYIPFNQRVYIAGRNLTELRHAQKTGEPLEFEVRLFEESSGKVLLRITEVVYYPDVSSMCYIRGRTFEGDYNFKKRIGSMRHIT